MTIDRTHPRRLGQAALFAAVAGLVLTACAHGQEQAPRPVPPPATPPQTASLQIAQLAVVSQANANQLAVMAEVVNTGTTVLKNRKIVLSAVVETNGRRVSMSLGQKDVGDLQPNEKREFVWSFPKGDHRKLTVTVIPARSPGTPGMPTPPRIEARRDLDVVPAAPPPRRRPRR